MPRLAAAAQLPASLAHAIAAGDSGLRSTLAAPGARVAGHTGAPDGGLLAENMALGAWLRRLSPVLADVAADLASSGREAAALRREDTELRTCIEQIGVEDPPPSPPAPRDRVQFESRPSQLQGAHDVGTS